MYNKIFLSVIIIIIVILCLGIILNNLPLNLETSKADIIIIGLGTAGSIIARRLHDALPNYKIIVLEKGKNRRNDPVVYNSANAVEAAYNNNYSTLLNSDNPDVQITVGSMYGGSSSHNFGLCVHGSSSFYIQNWLKYLNMTEYKFASYINKIESYMGKTENTNMRGSTGFLKVSQMPEKINVASRILPLLNKTFFEGFNLLYKSANVYFNAGPLRASDNFCKNVNNAIKKLKIVPIVEDYNIFNTSTCSTQQLFIDGVSGLRSSLDVAYLPNDYIFIDHLGKAKTGNGNLQIVPNARVNKFSTNYVEWKDENNTTKITNLNANGKIILAAGAIFTPYLLFNSGLGASITNNLTTHYGSTMIMSVLSNQNEDFNFSSGPVAFIPNIPGSNSRDLQLICGGEALLNKNLLHKVGVNFEEKPVGMKYIIFLFWNLKPKTRGNINNDLSEPYIELNLFEDGTLDDSNSDISVAVNGMKFMYQLSQEIKKNYPTLNVVYPPENIFKQDNNNELKNYVKQGVSMTDHYSCTCPIGSVLTPIDFIIYNHPNIHVVDASSFPNIPDGNTEFPTCLMAEIASDRIISSLKYRL